MKSYKCGTPAQAAFCLMIPIYLICWVHTSKAEVVQFEIVPSPGQGIETINIDLGEPIEKVVSITIECQVEIVANKNWGQRWTQYGVFTYTCEDPYIPPMMFTVSTKTDTNLPRYFQWETTQEGVFNVLGEIDIGQCGQSLFSNGTGELQLYHYHHYVIDFLYHCDQSDYSCGTCTWGSISFLSNVIVSVEYQPSVPIEKATWGQIKSFYR